MAVEMISDEKNLCPRRLDLVPTAMDLLSPFPPKRALLLAPVVPATELLVWDPGGSVSAGAGSSAPLPRIVGP
jgi:hypothetical protein